MSRLLPSTLAFVFACAALVARPGQAAVPTKDTSSWWAHIKVLASDDFQGRLTGSAGYRKAAQYVAAEFGRVGLEPAGTDGYFQNVRFEVQTIDTARSRVSLTRQRAAPTDISDALALTPSVIQRTDTRAPLVFAGYGIHMPEAGHDDFAGLNIRGAIVVFLVGGPQSLSGPQRAYAYTENLPHYLEEAGAVGVVSITNPKNREMPWARQKAAGSQPGMFLAEKALRRFREPLLAASIDEARVEPLFTGSGHTFAELLALADDHKPLPRFPLRTGLDAHAQTTLSTASADNVVGELPGSDPALRAKAVVLSAHLDHLGTGKPDGGDGIFRGAMDDASGVASMLEVARAFRTAKAKPRRSILFVAVCGEEKGLLGSRYFAAHPTRYAGHFEANINVDMFLPLYPLSHLVVYGIDESTLGDDARAVAAAAHVAIVPDPLPDHLFFVRSDQYNFVRAGTPAVILAMNPRPGTHEEATLKSWFETRYHAQADNLGQPVDLAAADAYNRLIYQLTARVADAQRRPTWRADSFFARFATHPLP